MLSVIAATRSRGSLHDYEAHISPRGEPPPSRRAELPPGAHTYIQNPQESPSCPPPWAKHHYLSDACLFLDCFSYPRRPR